MADEFHRLVTPDYFTDGAEFPSEAGVTYDYVNNAGSGMPAFADGAKVGSDNEGTYFIAFAEDATSSNLNRPSKALAQNCDHLDNLFHRSIAVTVVTGDVVPGAPVASIILPIDTFLGVVGYSTSPEDLNRLFEVLDDNDDEIIDPSTGTTVRVASVTLGADDLIGGTGLNGNFSGHTLTLVLNTSIPTAQTYRVYYGTRANLAELPLDALTNIVIRGAEEVSGAVEDLFRLLHGNNLSWNAAWTSTVYDLTKGGLNERYRLATEATASPIESYFSTVLDEPGAGAWIARNGPAVTAYAYGSGAYADPLNALFAAKFQDDDFPTSGGTVGFAVYGSRLTGTANTGEKSYQPGTAPFLSLWGHGHTSGFHASNPYTRLLAAAPLLLTTPNTDIDTGESVVEVNDGAQYFRDSGSDTSAIGLGYDLLEIQYTQSAVVQRRLVVVVLMGSSADSSNVRKVRVRNLDGTIPDFTGASAATLIRWHNTIFAIGDGAPILHNQLHGSYSGRVNIDGLFYSAPPKLLRLGGGDNIARSNAAATFVAAGTSASDVALRWGGFQYTQPSGPKIPGSLLTGQGGIYLEAPVDFDEEIITVIDGAFHIQNGVIVVEDGGSDSYIQSKKFVTPVDEVGTFSTTGTVDFDMANVSTFKHIVLDTSSADVTLTFNITNIQSGAEYKIYVSQVTGNIPTLVWGGSGLTHRFSGLDDQPTPTGNHLWVGFAASASVLLWTLTRFGS